MTNRVKNLIGVQEMRGPFDAARRLHNTGRPRPLLTLPDATELLLRSSSSGLGEVLIRP